MLTLTLREFLSEDQWMIEHRGGGCTIYQSFTMQGAWSLPRLKGFVEVEDWQDAHYRRVWVSGDDLAIVTYCEGDTTAQVFERKVTYNVGPRVRLQLLRLGTEVTQVHQKGWRIGCEPMHLNQGGICEIWASKLRHTLPPG